MKVQDERMAHRVYDLGFRIIEGLGSRVKEIRALGLGFRVAHDATSKPQVEEDAPAVALAVVGKGSM